MVQWLRLLAPSAGGPGSIPGQGTRSHMPQLKIPHAATKTQHNQYLKKKKKKERKEMPGKEVEQEFTISESLTAKN